MGFVGPGHDAVLREAQDLWDQDDQEEAVALLEGVLPSLRPKTNATDAVIIASLPVYTSDLGDPQRVLVLLSQVPVDGVRLTDAHLICLAARCSCRVAAGDLEGARCDRDTIHAKDPRNLSLLLADSALRQADETRGGNLGRDA